MPPDAAPALGGRRVLVKALYQGDLADGSVSVDDIDGGFRHDTGFVNQSGVRKLEATYARGMRMAPGGPA